MTLSIDMKVLEGQLSKYTNVMKGWQYRWFVLDPESGVLSYFMLEERGARERGRLQLVGAVVCPSDEDSHTFSVHAAAGQLYRLRAADARQRQHWVDRLRTVVQLHNRVQQEKGVSLGSAADAVAASAVTRSAATQMVPQSLSVLSSLHESSMALRAAQRQLDCLTAAVRQLPSSHAASGESVLLSNTDDDLLLLRATATTSLMCLEQCYWVLQQRRLAVTGCTSGVSSGSDAAHARNRPEKDFFSDVADWFDSNFGPAKSKRTVCESPAVEVAQDWSAAVVPDHATPSPAVTATTDTQHALPDTDQHVTFGPHLVLDERPQLPSAGTPPPPACDAEVRQLLSSQQLGGELTRLCLPASLLRPCSLLEVLAQFASRPLLLVAVARADSPVARMCAVLRWFCGGWRAALGPAATAAGQGKPYNPVLGETFHCWFRQPSPEAPPSPEQHVSECVVRVVCEQVSHHPPVSALYAECADVLLQASVSCRAPYNATTVTASLAGQMALLVLADGSTYTCHGFPAVHVRSPLGRARRLELAGPVRFSCQQTGCTATLNFHVQSGSGSGGDGTAGDRVTGQILAADGETVVRVGGQWRDRLLFENCGPDSPDSDNDTGHAPVERWLLPPALRPELDSRVVWASLSSALEAGHWQRAGDEKRRIETTQRQRTVPPARHFYQHDGHVWVYKPTSRCHHPPSSAN